MSTRLFGTPRIGGDRQVDLHVAPLTERPGHIVVMLQERTIADKMEPAIDASKCCAFGDRAGPMLAQ